MTKNKSENELLARNTVESLAAQNVRRLREARGWLQEQLAQQGARYGLPWTRETVLRIEQGRRKLSLTEALGLCAIFTVPLTELFRGEPKAWVHLANIVMPVSVLPDLLAKGKAPPGAEKRSQPQGALAGLPKHGPELADQRAAKTLGTEPMVVQLLANQLWQRSLSAERDRRAGQGANRMHKAHVTRELYTELSAALAHLSP